MNIGATALRLPPLDGEGQRVGWGRKHSGLECTPYKN